MFGKAISSYLNHTTYCLFLFKHGATCIDKVNAFFCECLKGSAFIVVEQICCTNLLFRIQWRSL